MRFLPVGLEREATMDPFASIRIGPLRPGCFGKLPIHADFIRWNASWQEVGLLDEWLQEGMALARQLGASPARPGPACFLFSPPNSLRFLLGCVAPSSDKAGREFPFLVFVLVPCPLFRRYPHLIPFAFAHFFVQAERIVSEGWRNRTIQQFLDEMGQLDIPPPPLDVVVHYDSDLRMRRWKELWNSIAPRSSDVTELTFWGNVQTVFHPSGAWKHCGIRIPLSGPDSNLQLSFWLDIGHTLANDARIPSLLFWNQGGAIVYYRKPRAKDFLPAFLGISDDDSVVHLAGASSAALRSGPIAETLTLPAPTMFDFVRALQHPQA